MRGTASLDDRTQPAVQETPLMLAIDQGGRRKSVRIYLCLHHAPASDRVLQQSAENQETSTAFKSGDVIGTTVMACSSCLFVSGD